MDGLMIEIAKNMTTHPDNNYVLHRYKIFFITAMSNKSWEDDMKDKIPACFKENVHHHGKLQRLKTKLRDIKNAIIINDEIDSGDKEEQKLHLILRDSGILDMKYMEEKNIRFVFVSATMINELRDLYKWGDKHYTHYMTIPDNYIGHKEFLELGIIQEYYPINDDETAEKWVREDILQNYGLDYRVHIVRTDEKNKDFIFNACMRNNIDFKNHTSDDRISHKEQSDIFNNITNHLVIAVKGLLRRADLIPNKWKMKIGATHERYVKKYDTNVQVQGLPGRMSGYWKDVILNGHKTGPHRTSIDAINEYEEFYKNPFGKIKYSTTGSKKLFVNPKHIQNLEIINQIKETPLIKIFNKFTDIDPWFKDYDENKPWFDENRKCIKRGPNKPNKEKKTDSNGFYMCITQTDKELKVRDTEHFEKIEKLNNWGFTKGKNDNLFRCYPCYRDINDINSLEWWFVYYKK